MTKNADNFPVYTGYKLKVGDVKAVCEKCEISITSQKIIKKIIEIVNRDTPLQPCDLADITALLLCEGSFSEAKAFSLFIELVAHAELKVVASDNFIELLRNTRAAFREEIYGAGNVVPLESVAFHFGYRK